jgi:hypothetical protein
VERAVYKDFWPFIFFASVHDYFILGGGYSKTEKSDFTGN